jgi:hypothetical protein
LIKLFVTRGVTSAPLVQAAGQSPPTLEPQARDNGWHRHGTTHSDTNETRSTPLCPLGQAGEKGLSLLMMVELFRRVGQHWVVIETVVGEQETLNPFHGKELLGKSSTKSPLPNMPMSLWVQHS